MGDGGGSIRGYHIHSVCIFLVFDFSFCFGLSYSSSTLRFGNASVGLHFLLLNLHPQNNAIWYAKNGSASTK